MRSCGAPARVLMLSCGGLLGVSALALLAIGPPAGRTDRVLYTATEVMRLSPAEPPGMLLPSDVAADRHGGVYVADGVNDRVLHFDENGVLRAEITQAGDRALANPIGVDVAADGRLWIADTGNGRLVALDADGTLAHEVDLRGNGAAVDATDVAVSKNGERVWLTDNDAHRLGYVDLASGSLSWSGEFGVSLGQFHYPFMLAAIGDGDVVVSDAINGRAQLLSATGRPVAAIGGFGVEPGKLYRPKGIAVDDDGNIWVADGRLGVIQVFRPTGGFLDVLRDADGAVLRLDTPCGIDLDADGGLYVAELLPNRVRKFAIRKDPGAIQAVRPERPAAAATIQPRSCAACHLEWVEPFASGHSTALGDPPRSTVDDPAVSRPDACLSCHDGTVVDSRRRVWVEHGHRTGVKLPLAMATTNRLPLVRGEVACRTCHSAHASGATQRLFAESIFLRVENEPTQLCLNCHAHFTAGAAAGMHPLGRMEGGVPEAVRAAAKHPREADSVTCLTCHSGHGATSDLLLVLDVSGNELCVSCHDQMRPGMFRTREGAPAHPLAPRLAPSQVQAARELDRPVGPNDELLCITCHGMHGARNDRFLLAFDLAGSVMCMRCHTDQQELIGSAHDLRTNYPDVPNALGLDPVRGGVCSACHNFHNLARTPAPGPLDPAGECRMCHGDEGLAHEARLGPLNHPEAVCVDCHDPHRAADAHFVKAETTALCTSCHADQAISADSPHNVQNTPDAWPEATRGAAGCLACHRPHGDEEHGLLRAGRAAGFDPADGTCIACHADAAWAAGSIAAMHPRELHDTSWPEELPLLDADEVGAERIACRTCHDPHAERVLRVAQDEPAEALCLSCHADQRSIAATGHSRSALDAADLEADACRPCHQVHSDPARLTKRQLWPAELRAAGVVPPNDQCLACHRPAGPAEAPAVASHPAVSMVNAAPQPNPDALPLYNERGDVDLFGAIRCKTCHLAHGRPLESTDSSTATDTASRAEQRARRSQLRPFRPPNACTTCHGFDALRRFLYYHDPQRRSGTRGDGQGGLVAMPRRQ